MHPRTLASLDQLRAADWFRNVGICDAENAIVLGSWAEAIASCSSTNWENLCLEAANQYCERLVERSPDRFSAWNDVANDVKPSVVALVAEKAAHVVAAHALPKVFVDTVNWDILHLAMEAEFADVYPPGFYASQAFWYLNGHFPCGWDGAFPEGTLVVY